MSGQPIYNLEKTVWTHEDYERMGWHDCRIHGISFEYSDSGWGTDLLLDIDYIFQWNDPEPLHSNFTFFIAPCTLVFSDCFSVLCNLDTHGGPIEPLEIADLYLEGKTEIEKNKFSYSWSVDLQNGFFKFSSFGMKQIVRQQPIYSKHQMLELDDRGGVSFSRVPC